MSLIIVSKYSPACKLTKKHIETRLSCEMLDDSKLGLMANIYTFCKMKTAYDKFSTVYSGFNINMHHITKLLHNNWQPTSIYVTTIYALSEKSKIN